MTVWYVQVWPHNLSINNVPCGGVEEELLPLHLLPNWPSVDEHSRHLGKPRNSSKSPDCFCIFRDLPRHSGTALDAGPVLEITRVSGK